ncbi:MAG: septal ring lytic transglycosylase RlpA family protein [Desulfobacterales bacterium]
MLMILLFCFGAGCARTPDPPITRVPVKSKPYKVMGKCYHPIDDSRGFREKGIASWYGADFHGRKTSNGETYDMYAMTAAHKILPLGTVVRVKNLRNGHQAEVRINDRGPFVRGRVIDLSYEAAKQLDIVGPGTAPVEVVALGIPSPSTAGAPQYVPTDYYTGNFAIQIGAFTIRENAEKLKSELARHYRDVRIIPFDDGNRVFYRVRLGGCRTLSMARKYEQEMISRGFEGVFVVSE